MPSSSFTRDEDILQILRTCRTVAVVGCSPNPQRDSHIVARFLKERGYRIIPVNPSETSILGEPCYPNLDAIPKPPELVDIFRQPEHVSALVDEALRIGAKALWLQEGVVDFEAARRARDAGLTVVMDRCMLKEWHRFQRDLTNS